MPETANRDPADLRRSNQIRLNINYRVMSSSIRNRLPGTIERIVSDKVVSEIVIRTAAGEVTSVITTSSVQRMNLKEGDQVFAIIKATEVSVEKE
jgi:molybdopterin-binding protein